MSRFDDFASMPRFVAVIQPPTYDAKFLGIDRAVDVARRSSVEERGWSVPYINRCFRSSSTCKGSRRILSRRRQNVNPSQPFASSLVEPGGIWCVDHFAHLFPSAS